MDGPKTAIRLGQSWAKREEGMKRTLITILLCVPTLAYADLLTTNTSAVSMTEGDSVTLTYTVTNTLSSSITLGNGMSSFGSITATFTSGDPTDKITTFDLSDASTCSLGEVLNPNHTCTIILLLGTDSPAGDTDVDSGMESLSASLFYTPAGGSLTNTSAPSVTVTVVDPVPEPSAFALLSTAVGAVGLLARKRRFPKPRFLLRKS